MALSVRRLARDDDRSGFCCGNIELDRYFQLYAGQNQFRHHIGTTYVAVEGDRVVGFVTVVPCNVEADRLPTRRRLPAGYALPLLRLARMGVDQRAQGRGIGLLLLRTVFSLAHRLADEFGCTGVAVDAKPEAVPFCKRFGFATSAVLRGQLGDRPQPTPMFLELGAIPRDPTADPG